MGDESSSDVAAAKLDDEDPSVTAVAEEPAVTRERAPEVKPGDLLAGRYQIEAMLGKGGSGVVLRAYDRVSATVVAVKVLKPGLTHDPRWEKRFQRELRLGRPVRHPNVCRIFDIGDSDGYRFLTMEYATGGTLRDLIKKNAAAAPTAGAPGRRGGRDRRARGDSRRRHRSPRRQARQHAAHGRRPPRAVRLRPRDRSPRQHDGQRLRRNATLHGARGSRRRSGNHAFRRLVARRRSSRDLLRQAARKSDRLEASRAFRGARLHPHRRPSSARCSRSARDASRTTQRIARRTRAPSRSSSKAPVDRAAFLASGSACGAARCRCGRCRRAVVSAWSASNASIGAHALQARCSPGFRGWFHRRARGLDESCHGRHEGAGTRPLFLVGRRRTPCAIIWGSPRKAEDVNVDTGVRRSRRSGAGEPIRPVVRTSRPTVASCCSPASTTAGGYRDTPQRQPRRKGREGGHGRLRSGLAQERRGVRLQHRRDPRGSVFTADDEVSAARRPWPRRSADDSREEPRAAQSDAVAMMCLRRTTSQWAVAVYEGPGLERADNVARARRARIRFGSPRDALFVVPSSRALSAGRPGLAKGDLSQDRTVSRTSTCVDVLISGQRALLLGRRERAMFGSTTARTSGRLTSDGENTAAAMSTTGDLLTRKTRASGDDEYLVASPDGTLRSVTDGQFDAAPDFSPDGMSWVYVDYPQKSIMICAVATNGASASTRRDASDLAAFLTGRIEGRLRDGRVPCRD